MKKFLSLVLALVMTMSLVTISAGAAEYKDLTDRNEIEYEEAVAVLNRLGIITGYSEGDFRPKTELTRGAAAKIIVSLLIGTEAANNLVAASAPYTDVPVDHTFAGVISYCKNSEIINGYSDGSFKPLGTLSGYAFAKMLLGALGYKGELEGGFTGAGWNMNVARLGNEAGLFDRLNFKGNETVNREQACQLALNTLKATMVEYSGGFTVTAGDASIVGAQSRSYKTSNQDYATHIYTKQDNVNQSGWYTVEFGEEHFVDLRLENDKVAPKQPIPNDMGQPSSRWTYKKVTIGTYALEPDFRYTELVAHNDKSSTDASKVRALGLADYKVNSTTSLWLNGYEEKFIGASAWTALSVAPDKADVGNIADLTDNGTVVEVYVSNTQADLITDVVVIQSNLMEVKRIGSDYVTLAKFDDDGADDRDGKLGYNRDAFDVVSIGGVTSKTINDVQVENECYALLSTLKVGDKVVIVPVSENGSNARYDVWEAYVPETVTGTLNRIETYGDASANRGTIGLTVGGTAYKAAEWNKDIIGISGEDIKVTKKDVTLTLDKYGNALLAEDVGATKTYMIVGYYYQSLVDGRLVDFVHGWDVDGNEVDLNLGRGGQLGRAKPGDLVRFESTTSGTAEWSLADGETGGNPAKIYSVDHRANGGAYQVTAYNTKIALIEGTNGRNTDVGDLSRSTTIDFASGVKFIYVEFNDDNEVESVEIRKGVQAASSDELCTYWDETAKRSAKVAAVDGPYDVEDWNTAEAYVSGKADDDGKDTRAVKAVVIKRESNSAISSNLLYIRDYLGSAQKSDSTGKIIYGYTVIMNTADGLAGEAKTIYSYENLDVGDFASYSEVQNDQVPDFYKLREHTNHYNKTTTTFVAKVSEILPSNDSIIVLDGDTYRTPDGKAIASTNEGGKPAVGTIDHDGGHDGKQIGELVNRVRVSGRTQWVDLTAHHIASTKDLKDFKDVKLAMVVNDNVESDGFRDVAMIIVQEATRKDSNEGDSSSNGGVKATVKQGTSGYPVVDFNVTKPDWAANDATGTVSASIYVDGVAEARPVTATTTTSGTVSARGETSYRDGTDLSVGTPTITWNKVKVTTDGSEHEDAVIPTSATVSETGSIEVKLPNGVYSSGKITIKQGTRTLKDAVALTQFDGTAEAITDLDIREGAALEISFSEMVLAPVTSSCKVNTTGAWTMTEIDGTKESATDVSFDITCATKIDTMAASGDVKAAISFTSAEGKNSPAVKSAVIKTQGVAVKAATYGVFAAASVDYTNSSNVWTTIISSAGSGTAGAGKVYTRSGAGTEGDPYVYAEVQSAPTTDQTNTVFYEMTADAVVDANAVAPIITVTFEMPREAVEITAVNVDTSKLVAAPSGS